MATISDSSSAGERLPILVIYAGGTIGMQASERGLVPGSDFTHRMAVALSALPDRRGLALPAHEVSENPRPVDSSSATPADWSRIAQQIARCYHDYSGFVVLHGTDTLAWCASTLAFQLQGLTKPVIVTGSQKPLDAADSDAPANLEAALSFAGLDALHEVGLVFGGRLLRGCRARKTYTHHPRGFESPNWLPLGEIDGGRAVLYPERCLRAQGAPRFELRSLPTTACVARLPLWPGMSATLVSQWLEAPSIQGAILECWGSGNVPEDPALIAVLAHAVGAGKPLVAVSQCPVGAVDIGTYASGEVLNEIGVLSADDMTTEAAFCKLLHLLQQPLPLTEIRRRFLTPLCGERTALEGSSNRAPAEGIPTG